MGFILKIFHFLAKAYMDRQDRIVAGAPDPVHKTGHEHCGKIGADIIDSFHKKME